MKPPRIPVKAMLRTAMRPLRDTRAATAVEYGLIVALIVIGLIAAIGGVGGTTGGMWNNTNAKYGAVTPK